VLPGFWPGDGFMPSSNEYIFQHSNKSMELTHFFSDEPSRWTCNNFRFGTYFTTSALHF
jgi:hypothetical protein